MSDIELLDTREAASILKVKPHTLEIWRANKRHRIPYLKIGSLVRYRRSDLEAFKARRVVDAEA